MKKVYVKQKVRTNADGEKLVTIETYESKPKWFSYIVFVEK